MSVFAILALVPLIATCAWCCGRRSTQEEVDHIRNAPCNIRDEALEESLRCRKSAGLVTLWIVFVLLTWVEELLLNRDFSGIIQS